MKYNNENWKGTSVYDFIKYINEKKGAKLDIDLDKVIINTWTIGDIINNLHQSIDIIMHGNGWTPKFKTVKDLTNWLERNYPEYNNITEVIEYFRLKYKLLNYE